MNKRDIQEAVRLESQRFQEAYSWLDTHMPPTFFEELDAERIMLIAHNFMSFPLQGYFSQISLRTKAIVLCLDRPDADLKVRPLQTFLYSPLP